MRRIWWYSRGSGCGKVGRTGAGGAGGQVPCGFGQPLNQGYAGGADCGADCGAAGAGAGAAGDAGAAGGATGATAGDDDVVDAEIVDEDTDKR